MTQDQIDRKILEIALQRATVLRSQATRHYQRVVKASSSGYGVLSEEEVDDARVAVDLAQLDVEACEVRLQLNEYGPPQAEVPE